MPLTTRQVVSLLAGIGAVSVLVELVVPREAHGAWWHGVVGFDLLVGFGGCLLLVWGAKALGALGLQQPEADHPEDEP